MEVSYSMDCDFDRALDFLHKLRELELAGDKNARRKLDEFERARAMNDLRAYLDFERTVLDSARNDFELLSSLDHGDLPRLLEDRNR